MLPNVFSFSHFNFKTLFIAELLTDKRRWWTESWWTGAAPPGWTPLLSSWRTLWTTPASCRAIWVRRPSNYLLYYNALLSGNFQNRNLGPNAWDQINLIYNVPPAEGDFLDSNQDYSINSESWGTLDFCLWKWSKMLNWPRARMWDFSIFSISEIMQ